MPKVPKFELTPRLKITTVMVVAVAAVMLISFFWGPASA